MLKSEMANCIHLEELRRSTRLAVSLAREIDHKNEELWKLKIELDEKERLLQDYIQGLNKMQSIEEKNQTLNYERASQSIKEIDISLKKELEFQSIREENKKVKSELELTKQNFVHITKKLEEQKYLYALHKKQLTSDVERMEYMNESQLKDFEPPCKELCFHACEKEQKLEESEKKKQIQLNDQEHEIYCNQESELECQDNLIQTLMCKERMSNDELQAARKQAICGLKDMLNHHRAVLGFKRMGEVNPRPFRDLCLQKYPSGDWNEECARLCSEWEENLKDANWHPFKIINSNGNLQEIIDEDDDKLKTLKNEEGEHVYKAVTDALWEMREYNASGCYPVLEIWNFKEGRKASLKEIIKYIIERWKALRSKKARVSL